MRCVALVENSFATVEAQASTAAPGAKKLWQQNMMRCAALRSCCRKLAHVHRIRMWPQFSRGNDLERGFSTASLITSGRWSREFRACVDTTPHTLDPAAVDCVRPVRFREEPVAAPREVDARRHERTSDLNFTSPSLFLPCQPGARSISTSASASPKAGTHRDGDGASATRGNSARDGDGDDGRRRHAYRRRRERRQHLNSNTNFRTCRSRAHQGRSKAGSD